MSNYKKDIESLRNPENIHEAVYSSSPYVLRTTFLRDPTIARLVRAGKEIVPLIRQELSTQGLKLPDMTLSALAYILEHVDLPSGPALLKPILRQSLKHPGPFFVNFATHALRQQAGLPARPLEMVYPMAEVREVLGQ